MTELNLSDSSSTHEKIISAAEDHARISLSCIKLIQYLPDISAYDDISDSSKTVLIESLKKVKGFYIKDRKKTEDIIFWLNQYLKECEKHGKTS